MNCTNDDHPHKGAHTTITHLTDPATTEHSTISSSLILQFQPHISVKTILAKLVLPTQYFKGGDLTFRFRNLNFARLNFENIENIEIRTAAKIYNFEI